MKEITLSFGSVESVLVMLGETTEAVSPRPHLVLCGARAVWTCRTRASRAGKPIRERTRSSHLDLSRLALPTASGVADVKHVGSRAIAQVCVDGNVNTKVKDGREERSAMRDVHVLFALV